MRGSRSWTAPLALCAAALACGGGAAGEAESCGQDGCAAAVTVAFVRPGAVAHASAAVPVELEVSGGTPDAVYLIIDGARGPALVPPFTAALDTSALAEGEHTLAAAALVGGRAVQARSSVALIVDRTPPQVVSLVPADGATGVWSRDPVTVTFSEPIDPASVTEDSLALADGGAAPVAHLGTLSPDGRTLSVTVLGSPPVPTVLHAALGRVRDRGGNALAGAPVNWGWELPAWQDLASPVYTFTRFGNDARLALDGRGDPTVVEWPQAWGTLSAARWSGSAWTALELPGTWAPGDWVRLDEDAEGRLALVVKRRDALPDLVATVWSGGAWSEPISLNVDPSQPASWPAVRMSKGGAAVVAWSEGGAVRAARFDGAGWTRLADVSADPELHPADVSFDEDGSPRVTGPAGSFSVASAAYSEAARSWTLSYADFVPLPAAPLVRASAAGDLYAAGLDPSAAPPSLGVFRYFPDEYRWVAVGSPPRFTPDQPQSSPDLTLDARGRPVLAWVEGDGVHAARWDGQGWEPLGGDLDDSLDLEAPDRARLAVGPGGETAVLWQATRPVRGMAEGQLLVKRYNR